MRWDLLDFQAEQFKCPCGCIWSQQIDANLLKLATQLQRIQRHLGRKLTLHQAYRCGKYNMEIGAPKLSEHVLGRAAIIELAGEPAEWLRGYVEALARSRTVAVAGICSAESERAKLYVDVGEGSRRWCQPAFPC